MLYHMSLAHIHLQYLVFLQLEHVCKQGGFVSLRSLSDPSSFHSRLDELAEERRRVEEEKLELEEQYKEAVLSDAQMLCQSFAFRLTNKLPLELRDIVYSYVWCVETFHSLEDDEFYLDLDLDGVDFMKRESDINRVLKDNAPWLLSCKGESCQCFFWWDFSIWVQPAFVGPQVAREAAAAYYRTLPLWMKYLDVHDMKSFMLHDQFHLDIRPADHLRQLYFWIEVTEMNELGHCFDRHVGREFLPRLEEYLRPLMEIRLKKSFNLKIRWADEDMESGHKLEALRSLIRPLRDAGAHVQILSSVYGMHGLYDVSDFYELPLSEWQSKWQHAVVVEQIGLAQLAQGDTSATSSESDEDVSDPEDNEEFSDLENEETESLQGSGREYESMVSNESSSSDRVSVNIDDIITIEAAQESVIFRLAERARADPALKSLMKIVAVGEASREQLQTFEEHMEELRTEAEAERQLTHRAH
jgi:hypothetical protein